ncbi:hypothetical protein PYW07_009097 [Mythimna separata]|uniref:Uncharacterized protein n=1 Tax=Mythimna separata TaxID=271217 RepID=A0AAD8DMW3_MYTSE|nr:hypothetical protein PYW07_009097 [Mythimna separata]
MMVVHEDSETPVEVAIIRKPLLEQKSYVIVKNHVRELIKTEENESPVMSSKEKSPQPLENVSKKKLKSDKKSKKTAQIPVASEECVDDTNITTEIDKNDLKELRTVYNKCKEVMRKIELKYGHLLDLDSEAGPSSRKKRKVSYEESTDTDCDCKLNTKIVFDDDGKQSTVENVPEKHICVKKPNKRQNEMQTRSKTIAIEYSDTEIALSDNLPELASLLQDPDLEKPLRYKIIEKMKMIKQEYVNDIRFNKHAIIEKIKANPDEVLDFKGTNLSTIPGYS